MSSASEENKVYTISMSTIIKMECDDCEKAKYLEKGDLNSCRILPGSDTTLTYYSEPENTKKRSGAQLTV